MKNDEAKKLVDVSLKQCKKEKRKKVIKGVAFPAAGGILAVNLGSSLPNAAIYVASNSVIVPVIITSLLSISAATLIGYIFKGEYYSLNANLETKISILKNYRDELKNGVNRFQNVNVEDFDKTIEDNLVKKLK